MRKLIFLIAVIVGICSISLAQGTGSVINDLNNFAYLRTNFQNALMSPYGGVGGAAGIGGGSCGIHAFVTTATADSVIIPGLTATSVVQVYPRANTPGAGTVLALPVAGDNCNVGIGGSGTGAGTGVVGTLYVNRQANTTSGLSYEYAVLKW